MARLLADENIPASTIAKCRTAAIDIDSVRDRSPGATDEQVIHIAASESRVILTFDKDFGAMVFGLGASRAPGIILIRMPMMQPDLLADRVVKALLSRDDWDGAFSVIESDRIRMTPLPRDP
ncbi:MAG: DUF5615 family PIN-like protein [Phycisphaerales bacterium]